MKFDLINQSIVIVANNFNPSLVNQLWLDEQKIVKKGEFGQGCIYTDNIVQINTNKFTLLVLPQQLQFIPNNTETAKDLIDDKLKKFVEALPHTPYAAAGINFILNIDSGSEKLSHLSRRLFYRDTPLYKNFDAEDAYYGVYLSKNVEKNVRLKLNVIPIKMVIPDKGEIETLQFSFNFHCDFKGEKPIEQLLLFISNWTNYFKEVEKIKNSLTHA